LLYPTNDFEINKLNFVVGKGVRKGLGLKKNLELDILPILCYLRKGD